MSNEIEQQTMQTGLQVLSDAFCDFDAQMNARLQKLETKNVQTEGNGMSAMSVDLTAIDKRLGKLENNIRMLDDKDNIEPVETKTVNKYSTSIMHYLQTGDVSKLEAKSICYQDGGILMEERVLNTIIDYMEKVCPIMSTVNLLHTTSKITKINKITQLQNTAQFYNENVPEQDLKIFTPTIEPVSIDLIPCMSVIDITRSMIEDMSNEVLFEWINKRISADFANSIAQAILTGDGNNTLNGIFNGKNKYEKIIVQDNKMSSGLLNMLAKLDDQYLSSAAWYMSSEMFGKLLNAIDAEDKKLLTSHLVFVNNQEYSYTLFGKPVYVTSMMSKVDDAPNSVIMLASLKEGYTLLRHPNVHFEQKYDSMFATKIRILHRMRLGGAVTNTKAFVMGHLASSPVGPV